MWGSSVVRFRDCHRDPMLFQFGPKQHGIPMATFKSDHKTGGLRIRNLYSKSISFAITLNFPNQAPPEEDLFRFGHVHLQPTEHVQATEQCSGLQVYDYVCQLRHRSLRGALNFCMQKFLPIGRIGILSLYFASCQLAMLRYIYFLKDNYHAMCNHLRTVPRTPISSIKHSYNFCAGQASQMGIRYLRASAPNSRQQNICHTQNPNFVNRLTLVASL